MEEGDGGERNHSDGAKEEIQILELTPLKKSNLKRFYSYSTNGGSISKKARKSVSFTTVTAFYFPREQGLICVPSQGGCTLGMAYNHSHMEQLMLDELAVRKQVEHERVFVASKKKRKLRTSSNVDKEVGVEGNADGDYCRLECERDTSSLQPVSMRRRRMLLKEAGVHKIEADEKDDCRKIRSSREVCGCTCEVNCNPDVCFCSLAGIQCQVDRVNFPCSCTATDCGNPNGRVSFDTVRVRNHFSETMIRLGHGEDGLRADVWNAPDSWSSDWNHAWNDGSEFRNESPVPQESSNNSSCEEKAVPSLGSLVKETIVSCAN